MTESHAEQLDPSVLGERVGDDGRPGDGFPPDEPLGVEDPSIVAGGVIAPDDLRQRAARDHDATDGRSAPGAPGLLDPSADAVNDDVPKLDDAEQQLVAVEGDIDDGPEAGAMRVVDEA